MSMEKPVHVVSALQVRGIQLINTGRTLAVQLKTADGTETAVLLPLAAAAELIHCVAEAFTVRGADADELAESSLLSPALG